MLVRPDGHVAWRADEPPADARAVIDVVRGAASTLLWPAPADAEAAGSAMPYGPRRKAMNQDIRAPYYRELGRLSFSPGWARPEPAMWPAPRPKFKPAVWRFAAAKAALDQAGEFVPVEQAERRNLIMVNPIEGNIYATSRNIVAAYQMVKAGEKARSHRHTAAALRLVVEASPAPIPWSTAPASTWCRATWC